MIVACLAAVANARVAVNALPIGEKAASALVSTVDNHAGVEKWTREVAVDDGADAEVGGGCEAYIVMTRLRWYVCSLEARTRCRWASEILFANLIALHSIYCRLISRHTCVSVRSVVKKELRGDTTTVINETANTQENAHAASQPSLLLPHVHPHCPAKAATLSFPPSPFSASLWHRSAEFRNVPS